MPKPTLLVLCTGNSCRSQMAEGMLRAVAGDLVEVVSAGSNPVGRLNARAVDVMREIGIDITGHRSKHMSEFFEGPVHTVITVCGNADQVCPTFPGQARRYHWGFDDPAHTRGTEEVVMADFRRVRDQMRLVFGAYAAGLRHGDGSRTKYKSLRKDWHGAATSSSPKLGRQECRPSVSPLRSGGILAADIGDEDVAAPSDARPRCGNFRNDL